METKNNQPAFTFSDPNNGARRPKEYFEVKTDDDKVREYEALREVFGDKAIHFMKMEQNPGDVKITEIKSNMTVPEQQDTMPKKQTKSDADINVMFDKLASGDINPVYDDTKQETEATEPTKDATVITSPLKEENIAIDPVVMDSDDKKKDQ